jgi:DNA-directed RNA polymerase specialized sigma24 family protein
VTREEYTSIGGDRRSFQTTPWTAIEQVRGGPCPQATLLIGELLQAYWKPVYCYLRHRGYGNEEAKDLTQDFFQEVVLGRALIQQADRTKGRFRTLLLRALDRFLTSVHRKKTARKRIPPQHLVPLEEKDLAALPPAAHPFDSDDAFNYAWVSDLLDRLLQEVRAECLDQGMAVHWELFRERVLRPLMEDRAPPGLAELCAAHDIEEPTRVSNMIFAVKRRFQSALKRRLRQSVADDAEIGGEIHDLLAFLTRPRQ